jgi:hypothetical protein
MMFHFMLRAMLDVMFDAIFYVMYAFNSSVMSFLMSGVLCQAGETDKQEGQTDKQIDSCQSIL